MATEHEHDAMPPVVKTQMLIRRSAEIQRPGKSPSGSSSSRTGDAGLREMFQGRFELGGADVQPKVRVERWARAHTDLFAIR
jgi:hypothetical protein